MYKKNCHFEIHHRKKKKVLSSEEMTKRYKLSATGFSQLFHNEFTVNQSHNQCMVFLRQGQSSLSRWTSCLPQCTNVPAYTSVLRPPSVWKRGKGGVGRQKISPEPCRKRFQQLARWSLPRIFSMSVFCKRVVCMRYDVSVTSLQPLTGCG